MLGFYSVRKLIETIKISDSTIKIKFDIQWYKNTKRVNWLNHAFIDENYDLTKSHSEQRDIEFICNLLVKRLLYRDGLMLVIDKPAGIAAHPSTDRKTQSTTTQTIV